MLGVNRRCKAMLHSPWRKMVKKVTSQFRLSYACIHNGKSEMNLITIGLFIILYVYVISK